MFFPWARRWVVATRVRRRSAARRSTVVVIREVNCIRLRGFAVARSGGGSPRNRATASPRFLFRGAHLAIDSHHLLQLHAQLDDLDLIQPHFLFGATALLPLAQRDHVRHAYKLAARVAVGPAGGAEAAD